jgi:surface polysaccharide O-acyltransferase-like enzyme
MAAQDSGRVVGIDYLRAFFSVCVVEVHLGYIFPSAIFNKTRYPDHTFTASDFVNFYVLCLAVPVFVLISTYLYARKPTDAAGLGRRLGRIVRLLVFWSVLYQVYRYTGFGAIKSIPHDPDELALYLMSGGSTFYYFFEGLAIITVIAHWATRLPARAVWLLFAASTILVGVLPVVHEATHVRFLAHHADPLNFAPYAFAGVGLARLPAVAAARARTWIGLACLALAGPAALLDWTVYVDPCFFEVNEFALPAYTRPSLVFLAVAVVVLALRVRTPPGPVVRFMATHSLAVYCLHPFFVDGRDKIIQVLHLTGLVAVLVPWAVVLGLSYLGSLVMPLFVREDLIR